jgi:hypothetical protein
MKRILGIAIFAAVLFPVASALADCTPMCEDRECGDDGCDGSCGECTDNKVCSQDGKCIEDQCGDITYDGCCDGPAKLKYCEFGVIQTVECKDASYPFCGWKADGELYDCNSDGLADPSGTLPWSCGGTCAKDCKDRECGSDGCGGSCGDCTDGSFCDWDGKCHASDCGDVTYEGCCDANGTVHYCEGFRLKQIDCVKSDQAFCGWSDEGYHDCGTDGMADPEGTPFSCVAGCTPQCLDKECGPDGCGKPCGECGAGKVCRDFLCVESECGAITEEGCCTPDGILKYCEDGEVVTLDCSDGGDWCGWNPDQEYYDCSTDGTADPDKKFPYSCEAACTPTCGERKCGPDGCGGLCGTCEEGQACSPDGLCVAGDCEGVTAAGCCDGEVLNYCDKGELVTADCEDGGFPHCGWDTTAGSYACGQDPATADPSGKYPMACGLAPTEPAGETAPADTAAPDAALMDLPQTDPGTGADPGTGTDLPAGTDPGKTGGGGGGGCHAGGAPFGWALLAFAVAFGALARRRRG